MKRTDRSLKTQLPRPQVEHKVAAASLLESASAGSSADLPPPQTSSLDQQLIQINERVRMHAQRLWQLPFAYLGVLGLLIQGFTGTTSPRRIEVISGCFVFVGICTGWAMGGAVEGIYRGVRALAKVEQLLKLPPTAQASPIGQYLPYFLVLFMGVLLAAATCLNASRHVTAAAAISVPASGAHKPPGAAPENRLTGRAPRPASQ